MCVQYWEKTMQGKTNKQIKDSNAYVGYAFFMIFSIVFVLGMSRIFGTGNTNDSNNEDKHTTYTDEEHMWITGEGDTIYV
jgi:hypothetical protein